MRSPRKAGRFWIRHLKLERAIPREVADSLEKHDQESRAVTGDGKGPRVENEDDTSNFSESDERVKRRVNDGTDPAAVLKCEEESLVLQAFLFPMTYPLLLRPTTTVPT